MTLKELLYEMEYRTLCHKNGHYWQKYKAPHENGLHMPHALWMIDEMKLGVMTWPKDKFHRWLGWLQCLLVSHEIFTLNEMRDMTRGLE